MAAEPEPDFMSFGFYSRALSPRAFRNLQSWAETLLLCFSHSPSICLMSGETDVRRVQFVYDQLWEAQEGQREHFQERGGCPQEQN